MDLGTQMSAHREPCVPSVVFLEENHGLVLAGGPKCGLLYQKWTTKEARLTKLLRLPRRFAWRLLAFCALEGSIGNGIWVS